MGKPVVVEHEDHDLPAFTPMSWSLKEIRDAIPPHLFIRSTTKSLLYMLRDISMAILIFCAALKLDTYFQATETALLLTPLGTEVVRWSAWCAYWWFQGLILTGIWIMGHECGHGAFSSHQRLNDIIGYGLHTFLLTPYYSWKIIHHRHHTGHSSMERDEVYVPMTKSDLGISRLANKEYLEDAPLYTFYTLVRQQLLAFPVYLATNVSGQKDYPKWTNHFNPYAIFFTPGQRRAVVLSNIGIFSMMAILVFTSRSIGFPLFARLYLVPYMLVNHWIIMITYLQHTDPSLPRYRNKAWNFQRGAAATIDREFLGVQGRFFLHDVAQTHVIHHFFPKMPWYNGMEATRHLRQKIGEHYSYDTQNPFKALWKNYSFCQYVDSEGHNAGDIVFFRNFAGKAVRRPASEYLHVQ
ncbi:fatty acid desaturase-domain-containing protein [Phlebopus sp. FC_14]|nr:fatty acid desaturase-domain-containing protein [Phlebopus sp. FC_14]